MIALSPAARISLALVPLTVAILGLSDWMGLLPDRSVQIAESRTDAVKMLAVQFVLAAETENLWAMRTTLAHFAEEYDGIREAVLRRPNGQIEILLPDLTEERPDPTALHHAVIPIFRGRERWGEVALSFDPIMATGFRGWLEIPLIRAALFVGVLGYLAYLALVRRAFKYLDPASVIPDRVKATLDVLAEGVLILDSREQIVLSNTSFTGISNQTLDELIGCKATTLGWRAAEAGGALDSSPWKRAMKERQSVTGSPIVLRDKNGQNHNLIVNCVPIIDDGSKVRGAIATFDDVTELQEKKEHLERTLETLEQSQEEIRRQNEALEFLASRDPLTSCFNRRAFLTRCEEAFAEASTSGEWLACIMADIDHFKSVNDNHGHTVGDEFIKLAASSFSSILLGDEDMICRYGGEEFCILLVGSNPKRAMQSAELARSRFEAQNYNGIRATASFGVSTSYSGKGDVGDLINRANQALYLSRERGRNRVTQEERGED